MQPKKLNHRGRPIKGVTRRRTISLTLDPLTWELIDHVVDVTPRASRGTVVESVLWAWAAETGRLSESESRAAIKAGLLKGKTA
jgi:hypothetical protein